MAGIFALLVGIASIFIALPLTLMVISGGPDYDTVIMNDVVLTGGGTPATIVAFCLATAFGAVTIFSLRTLVEAFRSVARVFALIHSPALCAGCNLRYRPISLSDCLFGAVQ